MPEIATTDQQPVPASRQIARRERISPRIRKALDAIATGRRATQREAAKLAGINECHLSRELKKPQIQAYIARKARETIALGKLRASYRAVELIDADSEHVSADMVKHVLAIEGIQPAGSGQTVGNTHINVGYVINLAGQPGPAIEATTINLGANAVQRIENAGE